MVSGPLNGTLSGAGSARTYSPNPTTMALTPSPSWRQMWASSSAEVTVTITVEPVNDPPIASDQFVVIDENTSVSIVLTGRTLRARH